MKKIKIFGLLLLIIMGNIVAIYSQNDDIYDSHTGKSKTEPINSGFVFIDGKYIDSPYEFEISGNKLLLNKNVVRELIKFGKNNKNVRVNDFPGYPPDSVASNLNYVNPETNNILLSDVVTYYVNKYGMDSAAMYVKEYVCTLNGVNCLETNTPSIKLITIHNGKEYYSTLGWNTLYMGNDKSKKDTWNDEETFKSLHNLMEMYVKTLQDDGTIFFLENKSYINGIKNYEKSLDFMKNAIPIINDEKLSLEDKKQLLKERNFIQFPDKLINSGFIINDNLQKRIIKVMNDTTSLNLNDFGNKYKSVKTVDSYSPNRNDVIYICPYTDDVAFNGSSGVYYYQDEIDLFNSVFTGYSYNPVTTITDERGDEVANIPISDWKNLNAGIINISAHGMENNYSSGVIGGTIIAIFDFGNTPLALNYINDEPYIVNNLAAIVTPSGSTLLQNCVTATENFWANNTQQTLNANNSIVFLSTCNGNIVADDIGGGAIFSFNQPVTFDDIYNDFRNILRNMNGQINSGDTRSAWETYLSVNSNHGLELIPLLADVTLCPATKTYYPPDGYAVGSNITSGYFEIDTWCDATKDPYQALNITTTGGVSLTSVAWDNPTGGKSNKINYTWTGTNGSVTVEVDPQHIVSYGGGNHQLDFNKETPNTETGYYTFYIDQSIPTEAPVADFSFDTQNAIYPTYTVYFSDISTNNPDTWLWDFGDGNTSTSQNPNYDFFNTGSYQVTLTVSNQYGSSSINKNIAIQGGSSNTLDVYCDVVPFSTEVDNSVTMSGGLGLNSGTPPYTYVFNYGQSHIYTMQSSNTFEICPQTHEYDATGTYNVYLTISDVNDNQVTCNTTVDIIETVSDACFDPIPNISYYNCITINKNNSIKFTDNTINGSILDWYWQWEVGTYDCSNINQDFVDCSSSIDEYAHCIKYLNKYYPFIEHFYTSPGNKLVHANPRCYDSSNNNYYEYTNPVTGNTGFWFGVNVVDCDITSLFNLGANIFVGAVRDDWGNPDYIHSGKFLFNGNANSYLSTGDIVLSACEEIVIEGDIEFIASGNSELTLEINNNLCMRDNQTKYFDLEGLLSNYNIDTNNINANIQNIGIIESINQDDSLKQIVDRINFFSANIYPNPTDGIANLTIQTSGYGLLTIEIYDNMGKLITDIYRGSISNGEYYFDLYLKPFSNGLYTCKIQSNNEIKIIKFIKGNG